MTNKEIHLCGVDWPVNGPTATKYHTNAANKEFQQRCACIVDIADELTAPHRGRHRCACGSILGNPEPTPVHDVSTLSKIRSILNMDDTRKGVIPMYHSAQYQTVVQTALLLSIAESLEKLVQFEEERI